MDWVKAMILRIDPHNRKLVLPICSITLSVLVLGVGTRNKQEFGYGYENTRFELKFLIQSTYVKMSILFK